MINEFYSFLRNEALFYDKKISYGFTRNILNDKTTRNLVNTSVAH